MVTYHGVQSVCEANHDRGVCEKRMGVEARSARIYQARTDLITHAIFAAGTRNTRDQISIYIRMRAHQHSHRGAYDSPRTACSAVSRVPTSIRICIRVAFT